MCAFVNEYHDWETILMNWDSHYQQIVKISRLSKRLVTQTVKSSERKINVGRLRQCFQKFQYHKRWGHFSSTNRTNYQNKRESDQRDSSNICRPEFFHHMCVKFAYKYSNRIFTDCIAHTHKGAGSPPAIVELRGKAIACWPIHISNRAQKFNLFSSQIW